MVNFLAVLGNFSYDNLTTLNYTDAVINFNPSLINSKIKSDYLLFEERINKLGKIQYDKLEFFTCKTASESIDYFDYINKINFYSDRYYLEKYTECIKFIEYILNECKILNMEKLGMKPFKEEERNGIMINLIKEKIELDGGCLV